MSGVHRRSYVSALVLNILIVLIVVVIFVWNERNYEYRDTVEIVLQNSAAVLVLMLFAFNGIYLHLKHVRRVSKFYYVLLWISWSVVMFFLIALCVFVSVDVSLLIWYYYYIVPVVLITAMYYSLIVMIACNNRVGYDEIMYDDITDNEDDLCCFQTQCTPTCQGVHKISYTLALIGILIGFSIEYSLYLLTGLGIMQTMGEYLELDNIFVYLIIYICLIVAPLLIFSSGITVHFKHSKKASPFYLSLLWIFWSLNIISMAITFNFFLDGSALWIPWTIILPALFTIYYSLLISLICNNRIVHDFTLDPLKKPNETTRFF